MHWVNFKNCFSEIYITHVPNNWSVRYLQTFIDSSGTRIVLNVNDNIMNSDFILVCYK